MKTFLLVLLFSLNCLASEKMENGIPLPLITEVSPNERIIKIPCGGSVQITSTVGLHVNKVTVVAVCDGK